MKVKIPCRARIEMPRRSYPAAKNSTAPLLISDPGAFRLDAISGIRSGGGVALAVSRVSELTAAECSLLIQEIRACRLSVAAIAALLGTSYGTVRAWIDGKRSPSRCARRSLWLLHRLLTKAEPISLNELISCGRLS
jgi:hypothetical protein